MNLAGKIEALTDKDLLGPWHITRAPVAAGTFTLALTNGDVAYPLEGSLSEALAEARRRNAAHVRERLRGLMNRPATCG